MPMESAVQFYERMESDGDLREKLKELGNIEKATSYAKEELRCDFTKEELRKAMLERNPEMTDEDLNSVGGGNDGPFGPGWFLPPLPK